jgi:hypothetical protein
MLMAHLMEFPRSNPINVLPGPTGMIARDKSGASKVVEAIFSGCVILPEIMSWNLMPVILSRAKPKRMNA